MPRPSRTSEALAVEWWPTARPVPYAANPRVISDTAVQKVALSIEEYGWRQPIVVDEAGVIIAGHTRLLAAQKLGCDQVPVHVATDLSAAQAKGLRLMDNRSSEERGWDDGLPVAELDALLGLDFDITYAGFEEDLEEVLASGDALGLAGHGADDADHVKIWQTVGKLRRRHGLVMGGEPREPGYRVVDWTCEAKRVRSTVKGG
jgi:hypothetical protein